MFQRKVFVNLLLVFSLVIAEIPFQSNAKEVNAAQEQTQVVEIPEEVSEEFELPMMETSAMPMGFLDLNEGTVELIDGVAVQWIDRLKLEGEEYRFAREFYNNLIEWTDNDGVEDWLIEDQYHTGDKLVYKFASVSEIAENYDTAKAIALDKLQKYAPYVLAVLSAFDRDHSEVFWLEGSASWYYSHGGNIVGSTATCNANLYFVLENSDTDIRQESYRTEASIRDAILERDNAIKGILSETEGMSDYEMLTYFNDTLTKTNEYNHIVGGLVSGTAYPDAWECISALKGGIGVDGPVCEGYARAFKVLCDMVDIPCVLVDGYAKTNTSSTGEGHMWNYVQAEDDKWYAVDVTWNDPLISTISAANSGLENDTWFMIGADTVVKNMAFIESHPVNNLVYSSSISFINGPVLSSSKYIMPMVTPTPMPSATPTATPFEPVMPDDSPVTLLGRSLTLSDDISVNFYMEFDNSVDRNNVEVRFTLANGRSKTIALNNAIETMDDSRFSGKTSYCFKYDVYATEMNQKITAKVYEGDMLQGTYDFSVEQYYNTLINENEYKEDTTTKALADSMMTYGEKAQLYFDPSDQNHVIGPQLVPLESTEKNRLEQYNRSVQKGVAHADMIDVYGMTLVLYAKTALRVGFEPIGENKLEDFDYKVFSKEFEEGDQAYQEVPCNTGSYGGVDHLNIPDIKPGDYDKIYNIVVTTKDGVEMLNITYSPFTYIKTVYNNYKNIPERKAIVDLVTALYRYNEAAENYQKMHPEL